MNGMERRIKMMKQHEAENSQKPAKKFRLWYKDRFWFDSFLISPEGAVHGTTRYDMNGEMHTLIDSVDRFDSYVLEQFTGKQDIEGQDIYEGDLVCMHLGRCNNIYPESAGVYEVIFEDTMFKLSVIKRNWLDTFFKTKKDVQMETIDPACPPIAITKLPLTNFDVCRTIGNIHENKELIKI